MTLSNNSLNYYKNFMIDDELTKASVEEVAQAIKSILGRGFEVNGYLDIPHNLKFALESQLLNYCKYSPKEVLAIFKQLRLLDLNIEKREREVSDILKKGYVFLSYNTFYDFVKPQLPENKKYEIILKRLWDLFERLREANEDVSRKERLRHSFINKVMKDVSLGKLLKHIYLNSQDVSYFGSTKDDGLIVYSSLNDLETLYLKLNNLKKVDDKGKLLDFITSKITEIAVRNEFLIELDFDYEGETLEESREVNIKVGKEAFERLKDLGVDVIFHTTGGKGAKLKLYIGRIYLPREYLLYLKSLILDEVSKVKEELEEKYNIPIELLDGENKYISLWWGRHRKTNEPKTVIDYSFKDNNKLRDWILGTEDFQLPVSLEMDKLTIDLALMMRMKVEKISVDDKIAFIQSLKKYINDLTDSKFTISEKNKKILEEILLSNRFDKVEVKPISKFEAKYDFVIDFKKIQEMEEFYKNKGLSVDDFDGVIFDFETSNIQPFAHRPVLATFYQPKVHRLSIWLRDESNEVEIYKDGEFEIRVVKSIDPEIILSAVFPEYVFLGIAISYLSQGSYLYEIDLEKFNLINPDISYILDFLESERRLYLVAHNIGYDLPLLMEILNGFKQSSILSIEMKDKEGDEDEFKISLYDGNITISAKLQKTGNGNIQAYVGAFKIGELNFKVMDTMNLANFWAGAGISKSLKALSKDFNRFFNKLELDVTEFDKEEVSREEIEYNVYDVLATYELIFSLEPVDLLDLTKVKFEVTGNKILSVDELISPKYFMAIKSPATIPKLYVEKLISKFNTSLYKNNSALVNGVFKKHFYGGRQITNFGRVNGVAYLDFDSQYPHILNMLRLENFLVNFAVREAHDLIRVLSDPDNKQYFRNRFERAIDSAIERWSFEPIAELLRVYPTGLFYVSPLVFKEIDRKVKFTKEGKFEFKGYKFNIENGAFGSSNERRRDVLAKGQYNIDLQTLIYWAFDWRLNNKSKKWKMFWNKLIRIDWNKSFIIELVDLIKPLGEYWAYGVKSYTISHIALAKRQEYKRLMKQASDPEQRRMYNIKQIALKVFANSSYGIFADETWSFRNYALASAITSTGRMMQRIAQLIAKSQGVELVYSDTDGMFFHTQVGDERLEKVRAFFNGVDGLKYEVEETIDEMEILASKNYRLKFGGKVKTKIHGRGAFVKSFAGEELFGEKFFNKVYDYLEGNEEVKNYSNYQVQQITLTSSKDNRQQKILKIVKYSKNKEKSLREKGYFVKDGYLVTHILTNQAKPFGKFFRVIKVSGRVDDQDVEYVLTAFASDEKVDKLVKSLGLEYVNKSVYDVLEGRLKTIKESFVIDIGMKKIKEAFKEKFLISPIPIKVILYEKPLNINLMFSKSAKLHTTEWMIPIEILKPTTNIAHVQHYAQAWANIYKMSKYLLGSRWISKTTDALIFRYKIEKNGDLINFKKTTEDDDADIRVICPLRAFEKTTIDGTYFSSRIQVVIDIDELGTLTDHRHVLFKVLHKWLEDLEPYIKNYVIDFEPPKPSTNLYRKIVEAYTILYILNMIINALKTNISSGNVLCTSKHYAETIAVNKKYVEEINYTLMLFANKVKELIYEQIDNSYYARLVGELKFAVNDNGIHIATKGLRASIYTVEKSKLDRLANRYRRYGTSKALKNFRKQREKIVNSDEMHYRIEVQAFGRDLFIEAYDILIDFISLTKNIIELVTLKLLQIPFGMVKEAIKVAFSEKLQAIKTFVSKLKQKGRAILRRLYRYTIRSISLIAAPKLENLGSMRGLMHKLMHSYLVEEDDTYGDIFEAMHKNRHHQAYETYMEYKEGDLLDPQELDDELTLTETLHEIANSRSLKYNPDLFY